MYVQVCSPDDSAILVLRKCLEWTRAVGLDSLGVDNSIGLVKRAVVVGLVVVPAKQERGEASENQKTARKWHSPLLCRRCSKKNWHAPFLGPK